jgi:hypothetical protein
MRCEGWYCGIGRRALHLLGDIATHPNWFDAERGKTHYREALALADQLGMRPLVAHCHLGLGRLYRRTGRRQAVQEHLTAATAMYRDMDMRLLFLGSDHASAAMAQRAKVLRRLEPIDLLEAQRDYHGLGKGEFKLRGQALRADVRGALFQKRNHGLVEFQECDPGGQAAYSVPGSEKLPTNDFSRD